MSLTRAPRDRLHLAVVAPLALCALTAAAALLAMRGCGGAVRAEDERSWPSEGVLSILAGDDGADAELVSVEDFLDTLEVLRDDASPCGLAMVEIEGDAGLVDVAAEVLGRYRDMGGVSLRASGYLDLAGNAWGAVLAGEGGWVDAVAVFERSDGGGVARVVRMDAG